MFIACISTVARRMAGRIWECMVIMSMQHMKWYGIICKQTAVN